MAALWAVDLGTTNTVVAVADEDGVRVLHLPGLSREQPVPNQLVVPSAVCAWESARPWLLGRRRVRQVCVGQDALDQNPDGTAANLALEFKRFLACEPHRPAVRLDSGDLSVREVTRLFIQHLLEAAAVQHPAPVMDLTMPAPVGYYEPYRAELQALARGLGVRRFRSLDEPIAAALGYGVNVARDEVLLVLDFGGGTLNMAALRLGPQAAETGAADILAKLMLPLGGADVDRWLVERIVPAAAREIPSWRHDLAWEAMRVKEEACREGASCFRWGGICQQVTRDDVTALLSEHDVYNTIRAGLAEISRQLREEQPEPAPAVDEVLLVGGSTLLPDVAAVVDQGMPGAIVRQDPEYLFTAVAMGAARFASGVPVDDFIYHDYALAVQSETTHEVEYELLAPRRTRYPTSREFAVRYYADYPGMTEMRFSVCEIGRLGHQPVAWERRPNGGLYWAPSGPDERAMAVELNPDDKPIQLRPPGRGTAPRLKVTYAINADRWLYTTVFDLVRGEALRIDEPVARLR